MLSRTFARRAVSHIETLLAHAGVKPTSHSPGLSPTIDPSTTFLREADGSYASGHIYSRISNPSRSTLEEAIASLEVAGSSSSSTIPPPTASAFSSGLAAASAIMMAHSPNCHVVLPDDCYHGVPAQLIDVMENLGVSWTPCDMTNISEVTDCIETSLARGEKTMLWLESPSNPLCKVSDIRELSKLAKGIGGDSVVVVVDSTWAPPTITQPLLLGADCVLHSATKYMGGHSDVLCGVVITGGGEVGTKLGESVRSVQTLIGAVPSPFDCFLVLRGLRSMHVRVERSCDNAMELARYLVSHPKVSAVHYPGLPTHPQHEIAGRQMVRYGGMLSFEVEGGRERAMDVAAGADLVKRATSLGGTETLIEHRASVEPEDRIISPEGLLRVSVGIERAEDIIRDFEVMLDRV
ncbi:hypothetical protein TrCOL_g9882 [Triparma columacea]|uniref:cystathionine gamma-lyase n=1 Tax=Triparma columacea TaxID=722753 RepID=A0A9W7GLM3_9STRA|nr:hypothetical protein TrCOL_g9882 [Triparma columacea]